MAKPPTFQAVIGDLGGDLIAVLFRTFEGATEKARSYFEENHVPVEWSLYADVARFWAKTYLVQAGHNAEFEMEELARNGLMATFAGYATRIRKSDNGGVPLPGNSEPYMAHLNQQMWLREADGDPRWNLMVLWQVTSGGGLDKLRLALTTSATKTSVSVAWIEDLPHPATGIGVRPDSGPDQGGMPREDIQIGPTAKEEGR